MKNKISKKTLVLISISFFIGVSVFTISQVNLSRQADLENKNKLLQQENQRLRAQTEYMDIETEFKGEADEYTNWIKLETIANELVKASDSKFKKTWALYLAKQSQQMDVDPFIAFELLKVETGGTFDPNLVGPKTAYGRAHGLAQFMKNTAPWIADMAGLPYEEDLLYDPFYSIHLSIVYLDFLHNQYQNWDEVLTAYNRGMGGLENFKERNGHAESSYAKKIQKNAATYETIAMR